MHWGIVVAVAALAAACACGAAAQGDQTLPLDYFRLSPDPNTSVRNSTNTLTISFNQPVQEAEVGTLTITRQSSSPVVVFEDSVHGPYITVKDATVTVALPDDVRLASSSSPYEVQLSAGSYEASLSGDLFDGIAPGVWQFHVSDDGPGFYASTIPAQLQFESTIGPLADQLSGDHVNDTIAYLSTTWDNRFFQAPSGVKAAAWVYAQYTALASSHGRLNEDVHVSFFPHRWMMPSVIVHIDGQSDTDDVVVVAAHLDSINRQNWTANVRTGAAPGADDDASGIAMCLEMFRVMMENDVVVEKSVEIHVYAAEEEGLYGSADIAAQYQRDGVKVAAMLQLDQLGWVRDPKDEKLALFVDNTDPTLNAFLYKVLVSYQPLRVVLSDENGRADSDFHSWTDNGYRACYVAEGPVDDIVYGNDKHTPYDRLNGVTISHVINIGRAALGFMLELAFTK